MKNKLSFEQKYISAAERRERVLLLLPSKGFANLNQFCIALGWGYTQLDKTLKSDKIWANSVCKIAYILDIEVSFLLER